MAAPAQLTSPPEAPGRPLVLALYAFAVFGWELVVTLLLDPAWRGVGAAAGALLHWGVTAAGWIAGSLLILRAARTSRAAARGVRAAAYTAALPGHALPRTISVIAAIALAIGIRTLVLGEWKLVGEYERLLPEHGDTAPLAGALLVAYYLCESLVIVLVLALGQRAGELRFGRPAIPWGGMLLAITWGATHILLQGPATGIYAIAASLLYGCIHALGSRRLGLTWALVSVAFIL